MFTSSKINKNESPSHSLSLGVRFCSDRVSVSTLQPLWDDASYSVLIETMESLKNGLQPHCGATPLVSMRTLLLVLWPSGRSFEVDTRCKRALNEL